MSGNNADESCGTEPKQYHCGLYYQKNQLYSTVELRGAAELGDNYFHQGGLIQFVCLSVHLFVCQEDKRKTSSANMEYF